MAWSTDQSPSASSSGGAYFTAHGRPHKLTPFPSVLQRTLPCRVEAKVVWLEVGFNSACPSAGVDLSADASQLGDD